MSNSSIRPIDRILSGSAPSRPEWTWEQWQWRGILHSPKLQHYLSLNIQLFSVILGHSLGKSNPSAEIQSVYSTTSGDWASVQMNKFIQWLLCKQLLLPTKHSSDLRLWILVWFRGWSIITTNPEHFSSTAQYHQALLVCYHSLGMAYPYWCLILSLLYIFLSDGESSRLVRYAKVELIMKYRHLKPIGNIIVIQSFLTISSHRSSCFSNLHPVYFRQKGTLILQ